MAIVEFFSNSFETNDNHQNQLLKTHYYNNTYEQVKDALNKICQEEKLYVINTNNIYREILIEGKKYDLIITCTKDSYSETVIDFKITTHYLISAKRGIKHIAYLYSRLDKLLRFKRLGN